jgi:hypothetical protein
MDRAEALWVSFATISAELATATDHHDIDWLQGELVAIEADLAELAVEPNCVVSSRAARHSGERCCRHRRGGRGMSSTFCFVLDAASAPP